MPPPTPPPEPTTNVTGTCCVPFSPPVTEMVTVPLYVPWTSPVGLALTVTVAGRMLLFRPTVSHPLLDVPTLMAVCEQAALHDTLIGWEFVKVDPAAAL